MAQQHFNWSRSNPARSCQLRTMKQLFLILSLCGLIACNTTVRALKPIVVAKGSDYAAKTADKVVNLGLNKAATALDTGNPYLHPLADAIRAQPDELFDPAGVRKLVDNYGDPNNKTKFKTLTSDLQDIAKQAYGRIDKVALAEAIASGLWNGAISGKKPTPAPTPTVSP